MAERPKDRLWIRVVEIHAAKVWAMIILTTSLGISMVILTIGAVWPTITDSKINDLGGNFNTLLAAVLTGGMTGVIGFLGGHAAAQQTRQAKPGEFPGDEDLILDLENPHEPPPIPPDSVP